VVVLVVRALRLVLVAVVVLVEWLKQTFEL
jgi:hypothetical protein